MSNLRIIERKISNVEWQTVRMQQLKAGDTFRMFEGDGVPSYPDALFEAVEAPYCNPADGVWGIVCNPIATLTKIVSEKSA